MSEPDESPRPPRRKRYQGKNPRKFAEKYKEHQPEAYPETIAKVRDSGKTPAGSHVPIMVEECLRALNCAPGMIGVDATLGYGGHAEQLLKGMLPEGRLIGLDLDPIEMSKTRARLEAMGYGEPQMTAVRSNYAGVLKALSQLGVAEVDFIFADLGCSSMQLDDPLRGFSYKHEGPLDMRMNPGHGLPADEWLSRISPAELVEVLRDHSDEPRAELLGPQLAGRSFRSTAALAAAVRKALLPIADSEEVERAIPRVFQAIRIAVNDEFAAIETFLRSVPFALRSGGRVAVLSFHSGEDRRVKQAFKQGLRDGVYREINDRVVVASADERRMNPRSSSAKLRWAERA